MYLWCDGPHDPAENMRRDAALLAAAERTADFAAVLRLFRFAPHGITLGYAQRPERELNLERCLRDGVPWVVRPTGGRAIFHAEEWTYALAARIDDPRWGGSLEQAYDAISALLVGSLNALGVPARHAAATTPRAGFRQWSRFDGSSKPQSGATESSATGAPHARERVAAACFASTARHEVLLNGRKLAGSAQRRTARALLQQGSVLLGNGHLRLMDYVAISDSIRDRARADLTTRATDAGSILGREAPLERWADALALELPGVRRLDGAAGLFLLTGPESGSYTASLR